MDTLIKAICRLAAADMQAMTNGVLANDGSEADRVTAWWQASMQARGRFVREFTEGMLELLEMQRRLVVGQIDRYSRDTERVAVHWAHGTERSVAIATQARRHAVDRRVFPLPLPVDRRGNFAGNRRASGVIWEHPTST